jgi:hypothetical protein|tara:strand:+ start:405 stop:1022 length:618 start_codon:yes stop_codon:yes gene_type:complete
MFKKENIIEARWTNEQQDTILVLVKDGDNNYETFIETNSAQHKQLIEAEWDAEKITEASAEWKKEQARILHEALTFSTKVEIREKLDEIEKDYDRSKAELDAKSQDIINAWNEKIEKLQLEFITKYTGVKLMHEKQLKDVEKINASKNSGDSVIEFIMKNNKNTSIVKTQIEKISELPHVAENKTLLNKVKKSKTLLTVLSHIAK